MANVMWHRVRPGRSIYTFKCPGIRFGLLFVGSDEVYLRSGDRATFFMEDDASRSFEIGFFALMSGRMALASKGVSLFKSP